MYHIDTLFAAHGHTVLQLPHYMCNLNPIKLAWRQMKDYVISHNTAGDIMSLTAMQELVQEAIKDVTKKTGPVIVATQQTSKIPIRNTMQLRRTLQTTSKLT